MRTLQGTRAYDHGMRGILVSLLTAAAIAPPVIHEPFTALPCPLHPDTTIDVVGCQEHRVLRTDRAIDAQVEDDLRRCCGRTARRSTFVGRRAELAAVPPSVVLGRGVDVRRRLGARSRAAELHAPAKHVASRRPHGDAEGARPALTIASS